VTHPPTAGKRLHIVHIITDLDAAGAEMMLYKVLTRMDRNRFTAEVVSLAGGGAVRRLIEAIDVPVRSLDLSPSILSGASALWRLRTILNERPDAIVQTWMYHADLLGGVATRLARRQPLIWDIQGSSLDPATTRLTTQAIIKICARLSWRLPRRIICCGHATRRAHIGLGYDGERIDVIPNAVDTSQFKPDATARREIRRELHLDDDRPLIGMAARFHPQKDYPTLIRALGRLRGHHGLDVPVVLCGMDVSDTNHELTTLLEQAACRTNVRLLGPRSDVARLFAACDVACLSSAYGEGLPNVVAEAMACGVPSVVTDVGDSGWVVGETGRVVAPRAPEALAAALAAMVEMPPEERRLLGEAARRRVIEHFEIGVVAERYHSLYTGVASGSL
jgi:glycosyltransferase involved in cell wall biosynthesis